MKGKKIKSVLMYIVLFIVFIALFYALKWFYSTRTETEYIRPTTPVEVVYPEYKEVEKSVTLSAFIEADALIPVTPYVEGTIIDYYVSEGDYVKEGSVIAKIDPEPYRLQKEQAEAAYLGYENSFSRVENLYNSDAISKQDYDTVKAQRDAMKAQLELAELQLSYTDVVAHTEGTVLKTVSSKGATAMKGTPIAMIADINDLVINLNLGEKYYSLFQSGKTDYKITVTKPADDYSEEVSTTAHIKSLSPYIDSKSRNFKLYLALDDPSLFKPGMYVKVTIVTDSKSGYSLDKKAMKLDGSAYYVEENLAKYVDFSGEYSNNDYVIVPDEYKDKPFIIKGQNNIFAGQQVNITEGN